MASGAVKKDDSDWVRTGQVKDAVQLRFYETSLYYDCTFSVSVTNEDGESCAKIFKCHRFVLAAASEVFEKLLSGGFKEANLQDRDDEINMEVSPTAFHLAMRFIYGNKCDFQSCELAVEIYYFAHKWMIGGLDRAAGEFLIKQLSPDDALLVLEMCIDLNIDSETELWKCCCSIIGEKSIEVLSSKHWLAAGRKTTLNIYSMACLTVGEANLLEKLVLWGKARCSSDQATDLRAEIDPMLKHIRFRSMSCQEFSAISKECDVLTTEEKLKIMESLSLSDANLMPPEFSLKGYPRNLSNSKMLDWSSVGRLNDGIGDTLPLKTTRFSFYVDQGGIFLEGIYLQSLQLADANSRVLAIYIACSVHKSDSNIKLGATKAKMDSSYNNDHDKWVTLFDEPVALAKEVLYYIDINYNTKCCNASPYSYMNGDRKFDGGPEFGSIFFHPDTKVRDVYGFKLSKC